MSTDIQLQPAFVLHTRPFRDSSLLVDFFSLSHGRVRAVARGARQTKSRQRSLLQAFQPLLVSMRGRNELQTLTASEPDAGAIALSGERLFSGLYLNELLTRLLPFFQGFPDLYAVYRETLERLAAGDAVELALRRFEYILLAELGYALDLHQDCLEGADIVTGAWYLFRPEQGFEPVPRPAAGHRQDAGLFRGEDIVALRDFAFSDVQTARAAKRLFRAALQVHLGAQPLHSRNLFGRSG